MDCGMIRQVRLTDRMRRLWLLLACRHACKGTRRQFPGRRLGPAFSGSGRQGATLPVRSGDLPGRPAGPGSVSALLPTLCLGVGCQ